ncbi:hypothetical protein CSUI_006572, partial [Cystoisospora suis]
GVFRHIGMCLYVVCAFDISVWNYFSTATYFCLSLSVFICRSVCIRLSLRKILPPPRHVTAVWLFLVSNP